MTSKKDTLEYRLREAKTGVAQAVLKLLDHHPDLEPKALLDAMFESVGNIVVQNARRHMWVGEAGLIIEAVAAAARIPPHRILGTSRESHVMLARYIAARIMRERGHALLAIGAALGGRDHTSIINGLGMINRRISEGNDEAETLLIEATDNAIELGLELSPVVRATQAVQVAMLTIPNWAEKARQARKRGATLRGLATVYHSTPDKVREALGEGLDA